MWEGGWGAGQGKAKGDPGSRIRASDPHSQYRGQGHGEAQDQTHSFKSSRGCRSEMDSQSQRGWRKGGERGGRAVTPWGMLGTLTPMCLPSCTGLPLP